MTADSFDVASKRADLGVVNVAVLETQNLIARYTKDARNVDISKAS